MLVEHKPICDDLHDQFKREDVEVNPLAHADEGGLWRAGRVEGRLPRHRDAVADDREQDQRVEGRRLHDEDGAAARLVIWPQAKEAYSVMPAITGGRSMGADLHQMRYASSLS